jgi:hypothetical protein
MFYISDPRIVYAVQLSEKCFSYVTIALALWLFGASNDLTLFTSIKSSMIDKILYAWQNIRLNDKDKDTVKYDKITVVNTRREMSNDRIMLIAISVTLLNVLLSFYTSFYLWIVPQQQYQSNTIITSRGIITNLTTVRQKPANTLFSLPGLSPEALSLLVSSVGVYQYMNTSTDNQLILPADITSNVHYHNMTENYSDPNIIMNFTSEIGWKVMVTTNCLANYYPSDLTGNAIANTSYVSGNGSWSAYNTSNYPVYAAATIFDECYQFYEEATGKVVNGVPNELTDQYQIAGGISTGIKTGTSIQSNYDTDSGLVFTVANTVFDCVTGYDHSFEMQYVEDLTEFNNCGNWKYSSMNTNISGWPGIRSADGGTVIYQKVTMTENGYFAEILTLTGSQPGQGLFNNIIQYTSINSSVAINVTTANVTDIITPWNVVDFEVFDIYGTSGESITDDFGSFMRSNSSELASMYSSILVAYVSKGVFQKLAILNGRNGLVTIIFVMIPITLTLISFLLARSIRMKNIWRPIDKVLWQTNDPEGDNCANQKYTSSGESYLSQRYKLNGDKQTKHVVLTVNNKKILFFEDNEILDDIVDNG